MEDYTLYLRDIDAPPIIVTAFPYEVHFAISEEPAERMHVLRCIEPELPDLQHQVRIKVHSLPEELYESKDHEGLVTTWKIRKENAEIVIRYLGIDKSDYPYEEALEIIEGDYFWIESWDD